MLLSRGNIRGWGGRIEKEEFSCREEGEHNADATAGDTPALRQTAFIFQIHWHEPLSTNWLLVTIVTRECAQFRIF